jgi:hypothetical protein
MISTYVESIILRLLDTLLFESIIEPKIKISVYNTLKLLMNPSQNTLFLLNLIDRFSSCVDHDVTFWYSAYVP